MIKQFENSNYIKMFVKSSHLFINNSSMRFYSLHYNIISKVV